MDAEGGEDGVESGGGVGEEFKVWYDIPGYGDRIIEGEFGVAV